MYGLIPLAVQPNLSAMLADSGPLFQVDRNASPEEAPSVLLHNKIRVAWGLDGDNGLASRMIATFPTAGTVDNLGTTGIAETIVILRWDDNAVDETRFEVQRAPYSSGVCGTFAAAAAAGGAGAAGALPGAPAPAKQQTVVKDEWSKTPRNAPCPCGSGKKFKMCHGATL